MRALRDSKIRIALFLRSAEEPWNEIVKFLKQRFCHIQTAFETEGMWRAQKAKKALENLDLSTSISGVICIDAFELSMNFLCSLLDRRVFLYGMEKPAGTDGLFLRKNGNLNFMTGGLL